MRGPSLGVVLIGMLSVLAIVAALRGAYFGAVASLLALSALLTLRVLRGRSETRRWLGTSPKSEGTRFGGVSMAVAEVRRAKLGNQYFREQIAGSVISAVATRMGAEEPPTHEELVSAEEYLLNSSKDDDAVREVIAPSKLSRLRGDPYLAAVQRAMELAKGA